MLSRRFFTTPLVLLGLGLFVRPVLAAGRVQLELVGEAQQGSPLVFQEWLQALGRAGIKNVRLRSSQESDRPAIDVRGTEESPVYMVTGVLGGRDEVFLPGARFRRSELGKLAEWLDDLAKRGPPDRREPLEAFGLTTRQFEKLRAGLARPIGFSTVDMARSDAVEKIGRQLSVPLTLEGGLAGGDEKIDEDLSTLSCGTVLACILRPIGFCMVPRQAGEALACSVAKARLDQEVWPIGWALPPKKPGPEVLPALFELRNVNVENVSAADVLRAIGRQIKVPILLDHNAMARHGIDPAKALVKHPQKRTNYSVALRKMLFQAGLKFELRLDEAGTPFLWVSTVKPV